MTEATALNRVKTICETHLNGFATEIIETSPIDAALYEITIAVITKEKSIPQALKSDMMNEYTNGGGKLKFAGQKKDIGDLSFDVMYVRAEINPHET